MTADQENTRDVVGWVRRYIAAGLRPLPLVFGEKELRDRDGLKRTYTAEEFSETENVGLQLGYGFVAIDFDAAEITPRMVNAFLPGTCGWGRASKPISQLLYKAPFNKSIIFKDMGAEDKKKATLVEVRATHQSMVPPSIHPNGENVVWLGEEIAPTELAVDTLRRQVALLASCALLVRYYPPGGARHYWGLHLAGFFKYLEIKHDEAVLLVTLAGQAVGDGDLKDRLDAVRSTYSRSDDEETGGARVLAEHMDPEQGPKFIAALRAIWGDSGRTEKEINRLNERHAVVFMQGGSVTVMTEDGEGLRFTRAADFKLLYPEPVIVGSTKNGDAMLRPLGDVWLTHPKRRYYEGIELNPNGSGRPGWYNMWKGFSVEPKQGDWSLYREHLRCVVDFNEEIERWVLGWMALTVRHPDQPIGTCIAIKGSQGTGKSTFCKWFGHLFGQHFLHLDSEQRLLGHFNAHLERAIVVLADEAVWAGGKQGLGALKRMITEETLTVERKYLDPIMVPNRLHVLVASNEDWVVPKAIDDRRFLVVRASTKYQNNREKFFSRVAKQLDEGGRAALLYSLLNDDTLLDGFNVHMPPATEEGRRQQDLTLDPLQAWWLEELEEKDLWSPFLTIVAQSKMLRDDRGASLCNGDHFFVDRDRVFARLENFLGKHARTVPSRNQLGVFLGDILPPGYPGIAFHKKKRGWMFPSLRVCREIWNKRHPQRHLTTVDV